MRKLRKRACNVENMTKLYDALLSGLYPQGRHRLRTGSKLCCLGVACEISKLGHWITDPMAYGYESYEIGDMRERYELPREVAKWLGLRGKSDEMLSLIFQPADRHGEGFISGSGMNDGDKSFAEIAEMIKKVYL